jgi:hypothetical protein
MNWLYVYNISKVELCALALDSLTNFQRKIQRIALFDLTKVGWNRVSPTYCLQLESTDGAAACLYFWIAPGRY